MNITVIKEAFGPFKICAVKVIDPKAKLDPAKKDSPTLQEHYLALGALYEMERKPASAAEKLFWSEKNAKGELVRGSFKRNEGIPPTPDAAEEIREVLEAAGYSEVTVTVRETTEAGPAWKTKVAALISMPDLDEDITMEQVKAMVAKLITKLGLDSAEVMAYAKSKGLK